MKHKIDGAAYRRMVISAAAAVEIPTPYGMITVTQKAGETPVISVPDGIVLE